MTRSAGATTPPPVTEGELRDIVGEVMRSFAGAPPRASTAAAAHGPTVSAYVSITGAWAGTVVVTFSEALARAATANMLRRPQGMPSTDDVSDAVGELANMIGGSVKARVPEPSALSLPVVARGRGYRSAAPGAQPLLAVDLAWGDEPMRVTVLGHDDP